MAGDYGDINSRTDFFRDLSRAREMTSQFLAKWPESWAIERISKELEAIDEWTANGRTPTPDERERVDIGRVALRELSESNLDGAEDYCQLLYVLDAYVTDWPDDTGQRQITKEEWFDLFFRYSGAEDAGMDREEYHRNFFGAEEKPGMTYWANDPPNSDHVSFRMDPRERELHMFLEAPGETSSGGSDLSRPVAPHVSYGTEEPADAAEVADVGEAAEATVEISWSDVLKKLKKNGVKFLNDAGPHRLVGRRGEDLVALTEDAGSEVWRLPLGSQEEGYIYADQHTILWNEGGEPGLLIAVDATNGRQLFELRRERAVMLDGDRCLTRNTDGTASLRWTKSGETITSLPGLSEDATYVLSPDRHWLAAGGGPIQVWDLEAVTLRYSIDAFMANKVEFTPDSAKLLVFTIMTPQSGMQDEVTRRTYDVSTGSLVDESSWWERQ